MTDYKELCAALREEAECESCSGLFCKNGCVYYSSIKALESIDKLKAERDAAIEDLGLFRSCFVCKKTNEDDSICNYCRHNGRNNWEWRGIQNDE